MPYSFPLGLADFFDRLKISEIRFEAPPQVQMAQTAGGDVLMAEVGPMLWRGQITLGRMSQSEADEAEVLLDLLGPAGRSFWIYDRRRPGPRFDPFGVVLAASVPTIEAVVSSREISIAGLPGGYRLARGDYMSFGSSGALHRVVSPIVQASIGSSTMIEITPPLRSGVTTGASVTLLKASCKARLVPGQTNRGWTRSKITQGMTFQFIQTLKG